MFVGCTNVAEPVNGVYAHVRDIDFYICKFPCGAGVPSWNVRFKSHFKKYVDFQLDSEGNSYVVGMCDSAVENATPGDLDVCIVKLRPTGSSVAIMQFRRDGIQGSRLQLDENSNSLTIFGSMKHVTSNGIAQNVKMEVKLDMMTLEIIVATMMVPPSGIGASG